jgi:hypothetical protein
MDDIELKKYIDSMTAQKNKIREDVIKLSIYSNGSIPLQDMYMIPVNEFSIIEKSITEKLKFEKGIKEQQML